VLRALFDKNRIYILDDGIASLSIHKNYKEYNFYSFLELDDTKLIKNKFSYLNESLSQDKIYDNKVVYFFGSPLVEKGIISNDYFIEKIREIVEYYRNQGIKFIYVMHRDEKLLKLDFIDRSNLIQFDIPVEMHFLKSSEVPQNIASFYSAALITLTKMFPNIMATSFYLKSEHINKPFQINIENCYVYYKKIFKVI
jgi:hypothetical protein